MIKKFIIFLITASVIGFGYIIVHPQVSNAVTASDWKAGNIIDDALFIDANSMTVAQIQSFLNNKVPVCDTMGTNGSTTTSRRDYASSVGLDIPFTCLKDFYEVPKTTPGPGIPANNYGGKPIPAGAKSAAQLIWDAGQKYNISPKVLLVKLGTESAGPLTSDDWPFLNQYTYAMGAHCPDSGPNGSANCNTDYSGFSIQMAEAAKLLRGYLDNMTQPYWLYKKPYQINNILWNIKESGCGGSDVYIEDKATAALYTYTPYQPNQAALNNMYGNGDSCSAYGNRNFWLTYNDWFGVTNNPSMQFAVIQDPNSSTLYLQTSAGKYYFSSDAMVQAWGLGTSTAMQVSKAYFDSFTTRGSVGRLVKDDDNNLFVVDNGKLHYVRDSSYTTLWKLDPSKAVQSTGMVRTMTNDRWVGRFVRDVNQPDGQVWLIDNGTKRAIPDGNALYAWGYASSQLTTLTTDYLNSIPTSTAVSQYASDGSTKYLIDMNRKLSFTNSNVENAFVGSQPPVVYAANTLSFLPTTSAWQFVTDISNGRWYMLENGKKHYITAGKIAEIWGKSPNQSLTGVSSRFIAGLPNGGNLQYIVQTTNPSMVWVIDGTKRYISTVATANAWTLPGTTIPTYSTQSLNHLDRGADITNIINGSGSPFSYLMDNGLKRYLSTPGATNGWGSATSTISNSLVASIPEGSFISNIVKNASGTAFLVMSGKAYPIDPLFNDAWGVSNSTRSVADQTVARYTAGPTLKSFVRIADVSYIMNNGQKIPIKKYADAYSATTSSEVILPADYFNTAPEASYLIKSTDSSDNRNWLMASGKKILLNTFEQKVSYGYLSRGIQPTALTPSTLDLIPDDTQSFSLLIKKPMSGIKLISFGYSLGFPDGDTLLSYIGSSNQITHVSASVFDSFVAIRSASRLIVDDHGNYYWMESGFKRHIPTFAALARYRALSPQETYLEGTTMNLIPLGPSTPI